MLTIKVYFFLLAINYEITINKDNTVEEVIEIIIDFYMNNPHTDNSLLKKGMDRNAYELKILDEEENFKPVPGLSALDKKRKLSSFGVKHLAFLEV
jgi:spore maturation protein CgeB